MQLRAMESGSKSVSLKMRSWGHRGPVGRTSSPYLIPSTRVLQLAIEESVTGVAVVGSSRPCRTPCVNAASRESSGHPRCCSYHSRNSRTSSPHLHATTRRDSSRGPTGGFGSRPEGLGSAPPMVVEHTWEFRHLDRSPRFGLPVACGHQLLPLARFRQCASLLPNLLASPFPDYPSLLHSPH